MWGPGAAGLGGLGFHVVAPLPALPRLPARRNHFQVLPTASASLSSREANVQTALGLCPASGAWAVAAHASQALLCSRSASVHPPAVLRQEQVR